MKSISRKLFSWNQFHEIFFKSISLKNQILAPSVYFQANEPKSRNLLIPPSGWMTTRTWLITDSQLCGSTGKWRISWGPNFVGPGIFFVKKGIFVEMLILNTRHLYYVHVWSLFQKSKNNNKENILLLCFLLTSDKSSIICWPTKDFIEFGWSLQKII